MKKTCDLTQRKLLQTQLNLTPLELHVHRRVRIILSITMIDLHTEILMIDSPINHNHNQIHS